MHGLRLDRILTGTAIALVLTVMAGTPAMSVDSMEIEAAVPIPEAANLPPPTIADIGPTTTASTPSTPSSAAAPSAPLAASTSATPPQAAAPAADAPATTPAVAVTPPAAAPDAAPPTVVATSPEAEKLREVIGPRLAKLTDRKNERAGVEQF